MGEARRNCFFCHVCFFPARNKLKIARRRRRKKNNKKSWEFLRFFVAFYFVLKNCGFDKDGEDLKLDSDVEKGVLTS